MTSRVHVMAEPRPASADERRIVQPCARCGVVLLEYDCDNPPNYAVSSDDPAPPAFTWFGVGEQYERDPGYPQHSVTMTMLVTDEEIVRDGLRLCDPSEVPEDVEAVRA